MDSTYLSRFLKLISWHFLDHWSEVGVFKSTGYLSIGTSLNKCIDWIFVIRFSVKTIGHQLFAPQWFGCSSLLKISHKNLMQLGRFQAYFTTYESTEGPQYSKSTYKQPFLRPVPLWTVLIQFLFPSFRRILFPHNVQIPLSKFANYNQVVGFES